MNFSSIRLHEHLPWLILLALPIVLYLPALTGTFNPDPLFFTGAVGDTGKLLGGYPWLDPNVGFQGQALGKLSADLWLHGHLPWWNYYNGVGLPLAAEAQPASLFLPFVLLMHFRSGGIWLKLLLQVIAGFSTYGLLRRTGLTRKAAFAGALIFELNGTYAWHGAPISTPLAFLPMLLLGVEVLRARVIADEGGGWWLIPLALAWSIYAGFPEIAYLNGLLAGVWVLARLEGMDGTRKIQFIRTLCLAVFAGILLSLPQIMPFAEYTARANIGGHSNAFVHARPPLAIAPLSLMPWVYGPIFAFNDPSGLLSSTWADVGGYLSALELLMVFWGLLFAPRRLYFFLLAWMLLCLGKTFDIRPISDLFNLIPAVKFTAFYRYSPPSWEFAGAVLVAMSIDGMQRKGSIARARVLTIFAMTCIVVLSALWQVHVLIHTLLKVHGYIPYFYLATGWLVASMAAAVPLVLLRHRWRHAVHALLVLIAIDACATFALPIRAGARHLTTHENGVTFLQQHAGLQRTYSLGPLAPNYGGYFKIAQINHDYLPISKDWVDYIHAHLDPAADPIIFIDNYGRHDRRSSAAEMLNQRFAAYEEIGVKYVIAAAGTHPFALESAATTTSTSSNHAVAFQLIKGQSTQISWQLPASPDTDRAVDRISVLIGNYRGYADGSLAVRLCSGNGTCVEGQRSLRESVDNAPFRINLSQPLILSSQASPRVTATISNRDSTYPVVLWLLTADPAQGITLDGKPGRNVPSISVGYRNDAGPHVKTVYDGTDMVIYELPNPKAYFETADPRCELQPQDRQQLDVSCSAPTQLLRREAFYPGWFATIDGKPSSIERVNEIFQGIALPAGRHTVVFAYRPTHGWLMLGGFVAGMLTLFVGMWLDMKRHMLRSMASNPMP